MNMKSVLPALLISCCLWISSCAPKDSSVKENVETKLKTNQPTATVMVMVNDGVATLSGEVDSDAAKADAEKMAHDSKGVKSVVNNITVKVPEPLASPVVVSMDAPLQQGVQDATKDYPTVTATVIDGVITLNGTLAKTKLQPLMMSLNALQPKKIENKLTLK
ncbi:MAG: BON domain-containing protein [Ferruginibacter sp.]